MDLTLALLRFFATGPGILAIGLLAILIILVWEWRVSLIGLVLIQLGIAPVAVFLQGVELQWVTVQTLVVMLSCLILALSATQISGSPTSRQSGNGLLRLMVVILLYASWRLFQFDIPIPLILPQVNVLFTWLFICALLMLALSDNPLFTGTALLLWLIPLHVVISVLFPFASLIVLFGIVELFLALCCSYLILAECLGEEERPLIATDVTFPVEEGWKPQTPPRGFPSVPLQDRTTTTMTAIPVLTNGQNEQTSRIAPGQQSSAYAVKPNPTPSDRTGEHPLVKTITKGRRSNNRAQPPTGESES